MVVFGSIPIFDSLVIIKKHISTRGCTTCENMIFCDHSWTKKEYPTKTNKYSLYIINIFLLKYVMYIVTFKMWSENRKRNTQCVLRSIGICHWFILLVLKIYYWPNSSKRPVLHHCVVIFFWSSGIMECTCMLFTFENGVLFMR